MAASRSGRSTADANRHLAGERAGLRFDPLLDSWDPDTDDDGLTDGQELKGVMRTTPSEVNEIHREFGLGTSLADTDGDGYWDGWLGVYGILAADSTGDISPVKLNLATKISE